MLVGPDEFGRLCKARELLSEVRDPALSIRAVARIAGFSHFHFIRQFAALFGCTPHQFRIAARLNHAKYLLAVEQEPVTSVCMKTGMSSLGSFSDLFTRRVGSAPSKYQRRARTAPEEMFPGCLSLMSRLPADAFRNFQEAVVEGAPVESEVCGSS